jgi:hypothetical protein
MRGLKIAAIAAFSMLLVMVGLVGYLFMTAEVQVIDIQAQGIAVAPAELDQIKQSIEQETFYGTLFQKPLEWKDASEYVNLTYTLRIRNNCLVPIDMIEVQVIPQSDDILQKADLKVKSLDLKSEGEVQVQILAPRNAHPIREMIVTYYLWGVSGNLRTIYGQ